MQKMSKSKGNYIGVTDAPNDMFGKVMSIPDELMDNYFTLLTDRAGGEISRSANRTRPTPRRRRSAWARPSSNRSTARMPRCRRRGIREGLRPEATARRDAGSRPAATRSRQNLLLPPSWSTPAARPNACLSRAASASTARRSPTPTGDHALRRHDRPGRQTPLCPAAPCSRFQIAR